MCVYRRYLFRAYFSLRMADLGLGQRRTKSEVHDVLATGAKIIAYQVARTFSDKDVLYGMMEEYR